MSGDRAAKAARKTWSSSAIYELVHAARAMPVDDGGRGPRYSRALVVEPEQRLKSQLLMAIAEQLVFRHPRVAAVKPRAERVLGRLFEALTAGEDGLFPPDMAEQLALPGTDRLRVACDYIAGMTDDFAVRTYRRLA